MSAIKVNRSLVIPDDEVDVRFTTSGGPGGQHANKASTRVELTWNIERSRVLGERQRDRLRHRLRTRLDASGKIRVASDRYRSQLRNRADAESRLGALVREALRVRRPRVSTAPTKGAVERRLTKKRQHSEKKRARRLPDDFD